MLRAHSRTGIYRFHTDGYEAFWPNRLPPDPPVDLGSLEPFLSRANLALGRLSGVGEFIPDPDRFVRMYVRQEAVLSSQIEGTQASLDDLLAHDVGLSEGGAAQALDIEEVSNYVRAMNGGLEAIQESGLSTGLLCKLHVELMQGTRGEDKSPGAMRRTQNWISKPGQRLGVAGALFVPPPHEAVPELMNDLAAYITSEDPTPVLVRCGIAHAQFETIHPFLDGNGRLGRLLIPLMLFDRGVLERPLLYLSVYLKEHQQAYYGWLMRVREEGDWEGWLRFFLEGVERSSMQAIGTAREVLTMRAEHLDLVKRELPRKPTAIPLLELLFQRPYLVASLVELELGVAPATATGLLGDFVRLGLLQEITGRRRDRVYRYDAYLAALKPK